MELYLPFRAGFSADTKAHEENIRRLETWARQVGGSWTLVSKDTDESRSSTTTTTPDTDLQFAVAANTKYRIRGKIWFDAATTPDFKYQFTWPSSPTHAHLLLEDMVSGGSGKTERIITDTTQADQSLLSLGAAGGFIEFDMILHNVNAGTFAFEWAQNTSSATAVVVLGGSYIEYQAL